jgi:hypothetical protein
MLIDKLSNILNFQQLYLSPTNTLPIFIPEMTIVRRLSLSTEAKKKASQTD